MQYVRKILTVSTVLLLMTLPVQGCSSDASDSCPRTENDVEGPYYVPGAPFRNDLASSGEPGERFMISGRVTRTDCETPVGEALIEVWQTDADGKYHYEDEGYRLRAQMRAGADGQYEFTTVKPGRYRIRQGYRPAHIHIKVSHAGFETITTQLYFQGDPYLWPNDACGSGCRSNDPKRIIRMESRKDGESAVSEGDFPIVLKPVGP